MAALSLRTDGMCGQARAREEELRQQLEASEKQTSEQAEIIRREKIVDAGEKMMLKLHHKLVRRHSDPTVACSFHRKLFRRRPTPVTAVHDRVVAVSQEAEQKTMLEHEKLKISELAQQVEQERVAAENAKATAEAEITDELKKARKILG